MARCNSVRGRGLMVSLFVCVSMAIVASVATWGQSQAINGTIRGRVVDPSGAAIPEAAVSVANRSTGFSRSGSTNSEGYYVFPNLPLGAYEVTVGKTGFGSLKYSNVVLEAGKEAVIDAQLKVGQVETAVEVTGGAPVVEPTRSNIGRTINEAEVQNLPLTSRNPYNFILFQPGVSGHPNPELGIPRTINTNGLMDRINYQMDGMVDTQSDRHGLRLFPISDTYVREVQTVANSFAPEFGGTTGNIFNVITNSGTNALHGQFEFIHRWLDATAEPMLTSKTAPKPVLTDYGVSAGAPVVKDKLFWFAGYEHLVRGVPSAITITPADAAALGIANSQLGASPGKLHAQFFNIRGDWNISNRHQLFLRYNYFRNDFPVNTTSNGNASSALSAWSDFTDRAHVAGAQLVSTISNTVLNEFRGGWAYRNNFHFPGPTAGPGPVVYIPGVAIFNGTNAAGDRFNEKAPNWNDNLTIIHKAHTFKVGVSMSKYVDLQRDLSFNQFQFPSVAAYLAAKAGTTPFGYTQFSSRQDPVGVHYSSLFWGVYAQDTWQVTPALVVTYGLRYDRYQPPDANPNAPFVFSRKFTTPNGDVAPRLGIAYRLSEKTVVRASGGIFFDAPATNLWFNSLNQDGSNRTRSITITCPANNCAAVPGAPAFPSVSFTAGTTPVQNVVTVTPNYKNQYIVDASLQVSRELSRNDAVSIGYVFAGGHQFTFLRDMNLINPAGSLADGRPIWPSCGGSTACLATSRLFPQFNAITLQDVGANSSYNAMLLTWTHRLSHGVQVQANYTWSHSISDAPDANSFEQNLPIEDPTNRTRDRGNSSVNRPHALTLSAVIEPQFKLDSRVANAALNHNMFAILGNYASGDAQNITISPNLTNDPIPGLPLRPNFVGRNPVRTSNIFQTDLRYTRSFKIGERFQPHFFLEANNLFNRRNVTTLFTTAAVDAAGNQLATQAATFLQGRSTVLESRIVQFGLGVRF
jgi:carboxypeptidase family protein/TonB-dependent receptor-like protein